VVVDMDTATTPWAVTSAATPPGSPTGDQRGGAGSRPDRRDDQGGGSVLLGWPPTSWSWPTAGAVRAEPARSAQFRHAAGWCTGIERAAVGGVGPAVRGGGVHPREVRAATADDRINSSLCYGFVAEIVAVRIDPDTLQITVDRVSSVHDAGTVLNQQLLDGRCTARSPTRWAGRCTRSSATRRRGSRPRPPSSTTCADQRGGRLRAAHRPPGQPVAAHPAGAKGAARARR